MFYAHTVSQIAGTISQFNLDVGANPALYLAVAALALTAIAGVVNNRAMSRLVDVLSEKD